MKKSLSSCDVSIVWISDSDRFGYIIISTDFSGQPNYLALKK